MENATSLQGIQRVFVYLTFPDETITSWDNWPCPSQPDPTCGFIDGSSQHRTLVLLPGTYTLEVRYLQGYNTSAQITWKIKGNPITSKKGGGLRIESIINYDKDKLIEARSFRYTNDNKTTGLLLSPPEYNYFFNMEVNPGMAGCTLGGNY